MQLKKILAIFLAATLIFSAFAFTVNAENSETFEVGVVAETATPVSASPVIYNNGEEVSVTISADQNTGIRVLKFVLEYDADVLELVDGSIVSNKLFPGEKISSSNPGKIVYTWVSEADSCATGTMFKATFKINEEFCGKVEISTGLFQGRPANCKNELGHNVDFVAGSAAFEAHDIVPEEGIVTDPTCTEEGYTTYKCLDCGNDVVGNIVDALGHDPLPAVEENHADSDCENAGSYEMVVYCDRCKAELSRDEFVIDALGHAPRAAVEENHVDPTCTEAGSYEMVVYCDRCEKELSRQSFVIEALGHDPLEAVEENHVDPTCLDAGSYEMVVYCDRCKAELSRELFVIDALGHDLVPHEAKAPTCTEIGWEAYNTCSRCDYTTYVEIASLGHTPAEAVKENYVASVCLGAGSYDMVVYCSVCKAELSREAFIIDAPGHDLIHHDAQAATCTEIGWEAYDTCSRCDYTTYVEIAALGHTPAEAVEENRVEATCLVNGSYDEVVYCSVCEAELSRETKTIFATGHSFSDPVKENIVDPTCTVAGSYDLVVYCSVCKAELSRNNYGIPALGHDLVAHEAQAVTCTEIGWNAYNTCSRCDYTTYVEIAALGHDLVAHEAKAETCTEIGWYAYNTCSRCDHTTYVEIAALGHDPLEAVEENHIDPTCTVAGSYEMVVYCNRCKAELNRESFVIEKLGHAPLEAVEENHVDPTCTVAGSYEMVVYCDRCKVELSRDSFVIDKLGHAPLDAVEENRVEPTHLATGSYDMVVYCERCNAELNRESFEIPMMGDADGDGETAVGDVAALLAGLTGDNAEAFINNPYYDFDGDGVVDADDATYLLYYILFGADAYPLLNEQAVPAQTEEAE